jgi:hypothetical protein
VNRQSEEMLEDSIPRVTLCRRSQRHVAGNSAPDVRQRIMASGRTVCRRDDEHPRVFGWRLSGTMCVLELMAVGESHMLAGIVKPPRCLVGDGAKHELEFGMRSAHGNEPAVSVAAKAW